MKRNVPLILPSQRPKKAEPDEILTNEQISFIQEVLEKSCIDKVCISRSKLYIELKSHIELPAEQYMFEQAVSAAINNGRLNGFELRRGAFGGICRKGAFVKKIKTK